MNFRKLFYLISFIACVLLGQIEPPDGLREYSPNVWALEGGNVYVEPGIIIKNTTIIIRGGLIKKVGTNLAIPKDASVLDMSGKTIYPGFIDSWVEFPVKMKENSFLMRIR